MQVLVHVPVLEGIMSGFLGGIGGGVEVLELRGKAHANLKGIGHSEYGDQDGGLDFEFDLCKSMAHATK